MEVMRGNSRFHDRTIKPFLEAVNTSKQMFASFSIKLLLCEPVRLF